jgi:hypothetical protein
VGRVGVGAGVGGGGWGWDGVGMGGAGVAYHTALCPRGQESKAISLQAWTGLEGSKRLRLPDFKTIGTRKW